MDKNWRRYTCFIICTLLENLVMAHQKALPGTKIKWWPIKRLSPALMAVCFPSKGLFWHQKALPSTDGCPFAIKKSWFIIKLSSPLIFLFYFRFFGCFLLFYFSFFYYFILAFFTLLFSHFLVVLFWLFHCSIFAFLGCFFLFFCVTLLLSLFINVFYCSVFAFLGFFTLLLGMFFTVLFSLFWLFLLPQI